MTSSRFLSKSNANSASKAQQLFYISPNTFTADQKRAQITSLSGWMCQFLSCFQLNLWVHAHWPARQQSLDQNYFAILQLHCLAEKLADCICSTYHPPLTQKKRSGEYLSVCWSFFFLGGGEGEREYYYYSIILHQPPPPQLKMLQSYSLQKHQPHISLATLTFHLDLQPWPIWAQEMWTGISSVLENK